MASGSLVARKFEINLFTIKFNGWHAVSIKQLHKKRLTTNYRSHTFAWMRGSLLKATGSACAKARSQIRRLHLTYCKQLQYLSVTRFDNRLSHDRQITSYEERWTTTCWQNRTGCTRWDRRKERATESVSRVFRYRLCSAGNYWIADLLVVFSAPGRRISR